MNFDRLVVLFLFFFTVSNAGGFIWLARNHMAHIRTDLRELIDRVVALEVVVARLDERTKG